MHINYYSISILHFHAGCKLGHYILIKTSHKVLTKEIAGKASPASALNHVMHMYIISQYTLKHL